MAWLTGWTYRKAIVIAHSDDGAQTDYQIKLLIGESSGATGEQVDCGGHVASDFDDLRFTTSDGQTLCPYWIESITGATPNQLATVWVKVSVAAHPDDTTIYMYYGGTETAVSSGADTFIAFDDFEDAGTYRDNWTDTASPPTVTRDTAVYAVHNASMKIVDDSASVEGALRNFSGQDKIRLCFRARAAQNNVTARIGVFSSGGAYGLMTLRFDNVGNITAHNNLSLTTLQAYSADIWYKFELLHDAAGHLWSCYIDDVLKAAGWNTYGNYTHQAVQHRCEFQTAAETGDLYIDGWFVAKWTANEPAFGSAGSEQTSYDVTVTDGVKIGDSRSTNLSMQSSVTDGLKGGDVSGGQASFQIAVSDGAKIGDLGLVGFLIDLILSDGVKIGDTRSVLFQTNPQLTDGMKSGDLPSMQAILQAILTEGLKAGDLPSMQAVLQAILTDGMKAGDTPSMQAVLQAILTDGMKSGDTPSMQAVLQAILTDGMKAGDTPSMQAVLQAILTDGMKSGDTPSMQAILQAILTDGVKSGDLPSMQAVLQSILTEGLKAGDLPSMQAVLQSILTEGLKAGDTPSMQAVLQAILTDGVKLSDQIHIRNIITLSLLDGFKAGDTGRITLTIYLALTEGIKLSDLLSVIRATRILSLFISSPAELTIETTDLTLLTIEENE